jgi:5-methylcytosine-specific restriction endonuclease McrA
VALLALLEEFVEVWDDPGGMPRRPGDAVYARDGWRCTAPGCTSLRHLEDHHLVYRSRGGGDELANRTCLCRFHHQRGEHGDLASCRGAAPLGLTWRLGTRALGKRFRNEIRLPPGPDHLG